MAQTAIAETIDFVVADFTRQRRFHAKKVARNKTVGEVVKSLLPRLGLASRDSNGDPVTFRIRLDREGRSVFPSEKVGDAVTDGDALTLERYIQAG